MSSIFAPVPDSNGGPQTKFGEMSIFVDGPHTAKNNKTYYKFTFNIVPWIDPANPPANADDMKVKTWKTNNGPWNAEFKQFWASICVEGHDASGAKAWALLPPFEFTLKTPDDLFTAEGQPTKSWLVSYMTPVFLIEAKPDDLKYAQDNNRYGMLEKSDIGQWMKKTYPIKLLNLYTDRAVWEADALKNAQNHAAPVTTPEVGPDYQAALTHLPILVKASGLNLATLETIINSNPHIAKFFTLNSPEVRLEVARLVITQTGPTDENAIKGVLIGLNGGGYLDIESPEIVSQRESVAF
jgi:hypothetical protein